jgi:hypothetical protein
MNRPTGHAQLTARLLLIQLLAILFLASSGNAQKISTTVNNPFDFATGKRYAWKENHIITRQGKANDALIGKKIVEEVNGNLQAKGFSEDAANPDFYISYDAGSSDLAVSGVEGEITGQPPISTAVVGPVYGIPQNVWYSVDGVIAFHMIDAKTGKPIWTGVAKKKIRDPRKGMKDMPKQIEEIVSKTFKKFPPKS